MADPVVQSPESHQELQSCRHRGVGPCRICRSTFRPAPFRDHGTVRSGKITLLNVIARIDRPTRIGGGRNQAGRLVGRRAGARGYRVRCVSDLQPHSVLTAAENVEIAAGPDASDAAGGADHVKTALRLVGLGDRWIIIPGSYPVAREKRVGVARAIVSDPIHDSRG